MPAKQHEPGSNRLSAGNQIAREASDAPEEEAQDSDAPKARRWQDAQGESGHQSISASSSYEKLTLFNSL